MVRRLRDFQFHFCIRGNVFYRLFVILGISSGDAVKVDESLFQNLDDLDLDDEDDEDDPDFDPDNASDDSA